MRASLQETNKYNTCLSNNWRYFILFILCFFIGCICIINIYILATGIQTRYVKQPLKSAKILIGLPAPQLELTGSANCTKFVCIPEMNEIACYECILEDIITELGVITLGRLPASMNLYIKDPREPNSMYKEGRDQFHLYSQAYIVRISKNPDITIEIAPGEPLSGVTLSDVTFVLGYNESWETKIV